MHAVMASKTTASDTQRENIALRWLMKQNEPDFSDTQRMELARWLIKDIDNCATYLRMVRAWQFAMWIHQVPPAPAAAHSQKSRAVRRRRRTQ